MATFEINNGNITNTEKISVNTTDVDARLRVHETTLGNVVQKLSSAKSAAAVDPASEIRQGDVITTDATPTTILTLATASATGYMVLYKVFGRCTGGTAGTVGFLTDWVRILGARNDAGVVTINADTIVTQASYEFVSSVTTVISGTNLLIQVTGSANWNVTWICEATIMKVTT